MWNLSTINSMNQAHDDNGNLAQKYSKQANDKSQVL